MHEDISIEHDLVIDAPPERVWSLLTDPDAIRRWYAFDGAVCEAVNGGRIEHRWSEHGRFLGKVLQVQPYGLFQYRYAAQPETEPQLGASTVVTFRLEPEGTGTRLFVTEHGFEQIAGSMVEARELAAMNLTAWRAGFTTLSDLARRR